MEIKDQANEKHNSGILDTVNLSAQTATLRTFNPQELVLEHVHKLPSREVEIVTRRHGLIDGKTQTLEQIGQSLKLTRERVRQIEKDAMQKLRQFPSSSNLDKGVELLFQIIENHGSIIKQQRILAIVLGNDTSVGANAILFLLNLAPRFNYLKETRALHPSWYLVGFDREIFDAVISQAIEILRQDPKPLEGSAFLTEIKAGSTEEIRAISPEALESMLEISRMIDRNSFGLWGLASSPEISPRDVGDKAFLILQHLGTPQHYATVTDQINKQKFDDRIAHKETVHNELIKDERFVLVGRGIYALQEWGYKKGIVAEIIEEVLGQADQGLTRGEIIDQVMKQRLVKRNTIIVGLSNRKRFQKTSDNRYVLTPASETNLKQ